VSDLRDKALGLIEAIDETPRVNGAGDGQMVRAIMDKIVQSTLADPNAH
jgi:geranylgeranyl diphosphate synthase type 3